MLWERRKMIVGIAGLFAARTALPQDTGQKSARKDHNIAAGEKEAKKLLLLMDKDQNGKVSKQEFMAFMEEEFERLDKDKNGELDVQELTQSRVRSSGAIHR
jgi:Ca2+-binding EF-hand superfamily protein